MSRLNILVTGVVQGVGYRYSVARRAKECQITGWVKNRSDGSVEIEAVGARGMLEEFLRYVRVGPPASHIAGLQTQWFDDEPVYKDFNIRF
ncbi:MAG: acylphosphatase [candidate division Zixibacteria bacterium]|nr:acylphosphatase [candidate division Zixibacteria bacterium]